MFDANAAFLGTSYRRNPSFVGKRWHTTPARSVLRYALNTGGLRTPEDGTTLTARDEQMRAADLRLHFAMQPRYSQIAGKIYA